MILKLLDKNYSEKIKSRLNQVWDIKYQYWYPLFNCDIQDVIAFDSKYFEDSKKLEFVKRLLRNHRVKNIYEFREDGTYNQVIDFFDYEFWHSDPYFWNNECFWFDDNMDWIMYISHEETITFGGKWLIENLKKEYVDWKNNISWDTKN
jgi:hypothetical protein